MTPNQVMAQISSTIGFCTKHSLSNRSNEHFIRDLPGMKKEVTFPNADSLNNGYSHVPYATFHGKLVEEGCFSVLLLDEAVLAFRYLFRNGELYKHTLCYFPSMDLAPFQDEVEGYEIDAVDLEVADVRRVPVPIRLDYSSEASAIPEPWHPSAHLTLGQHSDCRIPLQGPVSPMKFADFVFRNFYRSHFERLTNEFVIPSAQFSRTITQAEEEIVHMHWASA